MMAAKVYVTGLMPSANDEIISLHSLVERSLSISQKNRIRHAPTAGASIITNIGVRIQ